MGQRNLCIAALLVFLVFLQGCAGVRNSYESLLEQDADGQLIVLQVGEKREVLAVGNGFPGWWGYYPGIASHDPGVASITCKMGRSFIPFREPGIVFGGERCYLQAHKAGVTWVLTGNSYTLLRYVEEPEFKQVFGDAGRMSVRPEGSITVTVVEVKER